MVSAGCCWSGQPTSSELKQKKGGRGVASHIIKYEKGTSVLQNQTLSLREAKYNRRWSCDSGRMEVGSNSNLYLHLLRVILLLWRVGLPSSCFSRSFGCHMFALSNIKFVFLPGRGLGADKIHTLYTAKEQNNSARSTRVCTTFRFTAKPFPGNKGWLTLTVQFWFVTAWFHTKSSFTRTKMYRIYMYLLETLFYCVLLGFIQHLQRNSRQTTDTRRQKSSLLA